VEVFKVKLVPQSGTGGKKFNPAASSDMRATSLIPNGRITEKSLKGKDITHQAE
jgi:hypothetical protein